jgi:CMP-N-acetylneuraminic acid synthetase
MSEPTPKALAIVPARGGSKGIAGKNLRLFCGRPLLGWSVECGLRSGVFNRVLVSTDDLRIAEVARSEGAYVPFLRPPELARDETPISPVLAHALDWLRQQQDETYNYVFILEPTSPTRRPEHVAKAFERLRAEQGDTVVGVSAVPHHYVPPKLVHFGTDGLELTALDGSPIGAMTHRRQSLPVFYAMNGLIWGCRAELLRRTPPSIWGPRVLGFEISPEYAVDLDEPSDWEPAEARMRSMLAPASPRSFGR